MRTSRLLPLALAASVLIPVSALALEGIGPRITVSGTVEEVRISEQQEFDEEGGEFVIRATNGQLVTIVTNKDTKIISEGRMSRKNLLPINVTKDMEVRVRGWRIDSKTLTASLFIIVNVELNPALATNGTIQSITENSITILTTGGTSKTYSVTSETEVSINYTLRGFEGLNLIGKQALLTLNPRDKTTVRNLRITGNTAPVQTTRPTTVETGRRTE